MKHVYLCNASKCSLETVIKTLLILEPPMFLPQVHMIHLLASEPLTLFVLISLPVAVLPL